MANKCAFCGHEDFRRLNKNIYDYCLLLKSETLPVEGGLSIDVLVRPPLEEELRFCGLGCLRKWLEKNV